MEIVSVVAMIMIIIAFYFGIITGQRLSKSEEIKIPKIPTVKKEKIPLTKEYKDFKEQKKQVDKLNQIMKNIEVYDGTSKGQRRID